MIAEIQLLIKYVCSILFISGITGSKYAVGAAVGVGAITTIGLAIWHYIKNEIPPKK